MQCNIVDRCAVRYWPCGLVVQGSSQSSGSVPSDPVIRLSPLIAVLKHSESTVRGNLLSLLLKCKNQPLLNTEQIRSKLARCLNLIKMFLFFFQRRPIFAWLWKYTHAQNTIWCTQPAQNCMMNCGTSTDAHACATLYYTNTWSRTHMRRGSSRIERDREVKND